MINDVRLFLHMVIGYCIVFALCLPLAIQYVVVNKLGPEGLLIKAVVAKNESPITMGFGLTIFFVFVIHIILVATSFMKLYPSR